ncbi:MAG: porin family protein [Segetibacter sp.]|nr:porin family protein [Segetibacter sp.]
MKKIISAGLIFLGSITCEDLFAQSNQSNKLKFEAGYNVSMPVGSFKEDYVSKTSFRGGYGAVNYHFNPRFALGLNVGYQSFYERFGRQTYKMDNNQTVSAVVTNTVELMPVLVKGTFFPMGNSTAKVQPYVAAGAGVNFVNYGQYLGEFGGNDFSTPLTVQGGTGVSVAFGKTKTSAFKIGANYNYVPYNRNELTNLNSVGVHAGITFPLK